MKSIKTKLVISFSIMVLSVTLVVGFISIAIGYSSMKSEAKYSLKLLAAEGAKITESRMEAVISTLTIISMKKEIKDIEWEVNVDLLKEELEKTDFIDIGYVLPNGYTYYTDGTVRLMSDRAYITEALEGSAEISGVVISRVTRRPEIEVAVPVIKDNKVTGALVGRMEAEYLSTITKDISYGDHGYAFMIDGKGTMIAHPETERVVERFNPITASSNQSELRDLAKVFRKILQEQAGAAAYREADKHLYAGYAPIEGTDWCFVITADQGEVMAAIPDMVRVIQIMMCIVFVLSLGGVYLLEVSLTKPLIEMTQQSKRIGNLDLQMDIDDKYLKQKDEIGTLSRTFQTLTTNLRDIIAEIANSASRVSDTSQILAANSQQSATVSEDITRTMEDIARGAAEQAENTEAGLFQAGLLDQKIILNHQLMDHMNSTTEQITELVCIGLQDIDRLNLLTNENDFATKNAYEIMMNMKNSSLQIGDASKIISDMAKQTNLLALNASIEAARAGEAGKGFAVVAEEIQSMADQSSKSSRYIDTILKELHHHILQTAESMKKSLLTSEEQKKSVADTIVRYRDIAEAVSRSEQAVSELNCSEKDMEASNNKIKYMLESLAAIAEQNAAGTEQAAATLEEQTASAQVTAEICDRLNELSDELRKTITRFMI